MIDHKLTYRRDIDGLRAVAVLCVLLFHFGFEWFSGGYVGVDIFFVISGYLITQQIKAGIEEGSFSFSRFYERRARRLFPALFVMLLLVLFFGYFVLTPSHFRQLGESTIYSALSLSNILFYSQSGYFDTSATFKPLLHTWSLGVEEQFYLGWPLIVLLSASLAKSSRVSIAAPLTIVGFASLAISEYLVQSDSSAAFYFPHSRIFQFGLGGVIAILGLRCRSILLCEALLSIGLALIGYCILYFDQSTPFPGVNALYPSLGAGLVIAGGEGSLFLRRLMANRFSVFTGKISYSLYLYHWPIVVFFNYDRVAPTSHVERLSLLGACYLLAYLSFAFVETPFRRNLKSRPNVPASQFGFASLFVLLPLLFVSANIWGNGGWKWRFAQNNSAEEIEELFRLDELRVETISYFNGNVLGPYFDLAHNRTNVLVVGDSHARDVSNALTFSLDTDSFDIKMQAFDDDCVFILSGEAKRIAPSNQKRCASQLEALNQSLKVKQADLIVLSQAWSPDTAVKSMQLVEAIRQVASPRSPRIVVLGRSPDFFNFHNKAIALVSQGWTKAKINAAARSSVRITSDIDKILADLGERHGLEFLSKAPLICQSGSCDFFDPEGSLTVWDHNHWTLSGARLFGTRLARSLGLLGDRS